MDEIAVFATKQIELRRAQTAGKLLTCAAQALDVHVTEQRWRFSRVSHFHYFRSPKSYL